MKRLSAIGAWIVCACAGDPSQTLDAGASIRDGGQIPAEATVFRGGGRTTFVREDATSIQATDFSRESISVYAGPANDLLLIYGEGSADGTFEVRKVPEGIATLAFSGFEMFTTDRRQIDLSAHRMGREDVGIARRNTNIVLTLSGLAPWQEEDRVGLVVPSVALMLSDVVSWSPRDPPQPGVTTLEELLIDASYFPLIDRRKGDRVFFTHLVSRLTREGVPYSTLERFGEAPAFSLVDGSSVAVSAELSDVGARRELSIDWPIAELDRSAEWLPKSAQILAPLFQIGALHGYREHGPYDRPVQLAVVSPDLRVSAVNATIAFANPLPSWDELWAEAHGVVVFYPARGERDAFELGAFSGQVRPLDPSGVIVVEEMLSAVRAVEIEGRDAIEPQSGVGSRPTLRWMPPRIGTPSGYVVTVFEPLIFEGDTYVAVTAQITTDLTELQIPPEIMRADGEYVFEITAVDSGRESLVAAPYLRAPLHAQSSVLTAIIEP